jgi:glycerophosphoryl diester phosphodiesterase
MKKTGTTLFVLIITFLFLKAPETESKNQGELVAYRGGGQLVDYSSMDNFSCSASNLLQSDNQVIENTFQSVNEASAKGFDVIHLNILRTKDNDFAVFHDWKLNCATNGSGKISDYLIEDLEKLDAGYGYTFEQGESYPWKGKDIRISSLRSIVEAFPEKAYWLNLKNSDKRSVAVLNDYLKTLPFENGEETIVISSKRAAEHFKELSPSLLAISVDSTKTCLFDYMLYGWSRIFPESCKNTVMLVPPSKSHYLWGWPEGFSSRMSKNGTKTYLWLKNSEFKKEYDLRDQGIGIITGDLSYF